MEANEASAGEEGPSESASASAVLLNIPRVAPPPPSAGGDEAEDADEGEDGKSGKLTLATLIQEGLVEPGEGVLSIVSYAEYSATSTLLTLLLS